MDTRQWNDTLYNHEAIYVLIIWLYTRNKNNSIKNAIDLCKNTKFGSKNNYMHFCISCLSGNSFSEADRVRTTPRSVVEGRYLERYPAGLVTDVNALCNSGWPNSEGENGRLWVCVPPFCHLGRNVYVDNSPPKKMVIAYLNLTHFQSMSMLKPKKKSYYIPIFCV